MSREKAAVTLANWDAITPDIASSLQFIIPDTPSGTTGPRKKNDKTAAAETARRQALEWHSKYLLAVQGLERKLNIEQRWEAGCMEWDAAAAMVSKRRYQRALDALEGLIVARIFELTKMNMSQTGVFD